MNYKDKVGDIIAIIPNFEIVDKGKSKFMKVLSCLPPLVFFRKRFMTGYMTTIGSNVYWPYWNEDKENLDFHDLTVVVHEAGHGYDGHRLTWFLYSFCYLFPQILGIFALGALAAIWLSNWWLLWLLALLFFLPWPAPWRAYYEARACSAEAQVYRALKGNIPEDWRERRVKGIMVSWVYFRPCWREKSGYKILDSAIKEGHPVGAQAYAVLKK